jgi:hypothetical protein
LLPNRVKLYNPDGHDAGMIQKGENGAQQFATKQHELKTTMQ